MFGRKVELPTDLICRCAVASEPVKEHEYVVALNDRIAAAHDTARKHLKKAALYQRRHYDNKVTKDKYRVGDAVMMRINTVGISSKLQPKINGPYFITDVLTDVVARLKKSPRHKAKVVHTNLIKAFHGEVDWSWLTKVIDATVRVEETVPEVIETPVRVEETVPEVNETPVEEPLPEVTETPGEEPLPEVNETPVEKTVPEVNETPVRVQETLPNTEQFIRHPRRRKPPDRYGEWCK